MDPDSFQNDTQKNNENKKHKIDEKSKFSIPTRSLGGGREVNFRYFFGSGRPWDILGRPRAPKLSQNLPQQPPGPPRASIFHDFVSIFDAVFCSFCCFVGLSSMSLRHAETKNAVGTVAEMARRATGYSSRYLCVFLWILV